jgi:hypothetical protein
MNGTANKEREHAIQKGIFKKVYHLLQLCAIVVGVSGPINTHMAGFGVIFCLHFKKMLYIGIRNILYYICSAAQNKKLVPRAYKCFKNWSDSVQSMEGDSILDGFLNCEKGTWGKIYKSNCRW